MSNPACHAHPEAEAASACSACLKPLCSVCLVFDRYRPACAGCALELRTARRRRVALFSILGLLLVPVVAGAVLVLALTWKPPFDYGKHQTKVDAQKEILRAEPCDRQAVVTLTDTMLEAGDTRGTLATAEKFFEKCGDLSRLRWITYAAHKRLGEWREAVSDATRLIESDPTDKDFRWWRGICYEQLGRWADAAADYEKAIELQPRLTNIPFNLASVYERMGKPCDAAKAIRRFLSQHPESETAAVRSRLDTLALGCDPGVPL